MTRSTAPVDPLEPEITAIRARQRQLEAAATRGGDTIVTVTDLRTGRVAIYRTP